MGRGWKIALGVLATLAILLGVNALVTAGESAEAEVTVPGGRILDLPGGDVQVVEHGPREAEPIVLLHCFTCAIDWWDGMAPRLAQSRRVIAVDLLGHGGSEKPEDGYGPAEQADVVAQALDRLGVREAEVVGHSLGGAVAVALAERSPALVERVAILDTRSSREDEGDLGILAALAFTPVIGDALWRVKTDAAIRKGLAVAFAPDFEVPDEFVEDVRRMTYNAYDKSPAGFDAYAEEMSLADRYARTGKPLLVAMGSEEQIIDDPVAALAAYEAAVPDARTELFEGIGHSPNVEAPARTAALVLSFGGDEVAANHRKTKQRVQDAMQDRDAVRARP